MNFDDATDDQLAALADKAFRLGLQHGRRMSGPVDAYQIMLLLGHADSQRRKFHTKKLRQVYGAGFDISFAMHTGIKP